ncbi:MAG TPA: LysM peptidoglycan-binding domain-containing protein [Patescibacteria group bacterium]|nr:LysM peptidoglycan-binding domain-containing protein [Patescibacteria group bacterium]
MPRKKVSVKKSSKKEVVLKRNVSTSPIAKSYISLLYGVLSVVILFVIIFLGLKALSARPNPQISDQAANTEAKVTYTVKTGDSLWTIAQDQLKDGYQWTRIAEANKISDPNIIEKGMVLTMPAIETPTVSPTVSPKPTTVPTAPIAMQSAPNSAGSKITGSSYTVVRGDNLWDIAVRAYGDGYKWTEIAKANNLANPRIIHSGNKFILPR